MAKSKIVSGSPASIATLLLLLPILGCTQGYEPMQSRHFEHDGVQRKYFVHVPKQATGPLPVVFAVHGYSSTATGFQAAHDLNDHADQNGYMVVYPQGTHWLVELEGGSSYRPTTWNTFGKGEPSPDAVESEFESDASCFYALGVSNGGMMVLRIRCQ
jgi:polyhydroxybutyrate depolymerase